MGRKKEIPYLLHERGRFFYQRRVPKALQQTVGSRKWHRPAGENYAKAVAKVLAWAEEDDALIASLRDPDAAREFRTRQRREREQQEWKKDAAERAAYREWLESGGLKNAEEYGDREDAAYMDELNRSVWRELHWLVPACERDHLSPKTEEEMDAEFERVKELLANDPDVRVTRDRSLPRVVDRGEHHDNLVGLYNAAFGPDAEVPSDPDERDEYDAWKMRLQRKIARVAPPKDTISGVAERYFAFVDSKPTTLRKYREHIGALVKQVGDIPIHHVTATMLREHRERLMTEGDGMNPASVRAHFTPIRGLFAHALDEELIDTNPMAGVRLPRDKRAVEEIRWLPFDPEEMSRILAGAKQHWGKPIPGVSRERREAFVMLIRVLAYTAMRPIEVMLLRPGDVDEKAIRIEGGKTNSAWRVIPLHPAIKDFPEWINGGGMEAIAGIKTDLVAPLRQNFSKLIQKRLSPPITENRKVLYSLRSTFSNAMRRAGAPVDVRRAILGHVEGGALRHYDDGPEFDMKREWIEKTDPCRGHGDYSSIQRSF